MEHHEEGIRKRIGLTTSAAVDTVQYCYCTYVLHSNSARTAHVQPRFPPPLPIALVSLYRSCQTTLIATIAPESLPHRHSERCNGDEQNAQQGGGQVDDVSTPPGVESETPPCVARIPRMTSLASMPTLDTTSTEAASAVSPTSCAVSAYRYSPLPEDCTRLLRLMPHPDERAPIQCQLFNCFLDSGKGTRPYEALSYVWGSPGNPRSIFIDGDFVPVTANLHMALLRLRDCSVDRIIWVDAICINQDDVEERSRQVQSMAKIYAKASRVVVWFEEAMAGSDRVLGALCRAANGQLTMSSDRETDKQTILALLRRSWFRRIWVRQWRLGAIARGC